MKILSLKCSRFGYSCVRPALNAAEYREPNANEWKLCLLLLVAVEVGDDKKVRSAAKAARRIARKAAVTSIIVNGFAHLSSNLAPPDVSSTCLDDLRAELQRGQDWEITVLPFGWHKAMEISLCADEWSQKFIHV